MGTKVRSKLIAFLDKGPFKNDDAICEKGRIIYWAIFRAQDGTLQTYAYVPKILTHTSQRAEHYIKLRMRMRAHLDTMLTFAAAFVIFIMSYR